MASEVATNRAPLFFGSLRGYKTSWLRPDLIAGLTVWAVLIPESLAYATIAGVPPVVGLYAAVPALVFYAALGSSRHLVVSPMSATAALSVSIVAGFAKGGTANFMHVTAALAVVTGVLGLLAGVARLGFLASFISGPVFKGFIVGLALTIIVGQLPALFGVPKGKGNFFEKLWHLLTHLSDTSLTTLTVGLVSLVAILVLRRWLPLVPGSLVVVLVSIAAVWMFNLDKHGIEIVGHIDSGLPQIGLPSVPSSMSWLQLVTPAIGILLVGYAEGLAAAKTYAAKAGYDIDANRELLGLGAANLGAGLSSGMVVNGSLSKTAVNGGAGAKSQVSGLTVAALTVLTLLFLTGLFEYLPEATLAAVVIAAVVDLVNIPSLVRLYKVWSSRLGHDYGWAARADFLAALAALLGVLFFDTLTGLFIGIGASMLLLLDRSSRPHIARLARESTGAWVDVQRHSGLTPDPEVPVLRVESGLFFANSHDVHETIRAAVGPSTRGVVVDAETAPFIDVTATDMLAQAAIELDRSSVRLAVAHPVGQIRDVVLSCAKENHTKIEVYPTIDLAIAALSAPTSPTNSD
ncbi:MAG TPA: SulP family inorganic anion transporter [Actinomycetes bacterium]|nr:SulP family inorganic anion transporter [Actinomycetes bacterium]